MVSIAPGRTEGRFRRLIRMNVKCVR